MIRTVKPVTGNDTVHCGTGAATSGSDQWKDAIRVPEHSAGAAVGKT